MKKNWMRLLSLLCALTMIIGEIPILAWAEPVPATPTDLAPVQTSDIQDNEPAQADTSADTEPSAADSTVKTDPPADDDAPSKAEAPAVTDQADRTDVPAKADAPAAESAESTPAKDDVPEKQDKPAEASIPAEKPAADLELKIGKEAVFTLQAGKSYTIRIPGRNGKMQIDAESAFALQIDIKDEVSNKSKVAKGEANKPFQTIFGGHSDRTYLLTVTALNKQASGTVKLTVTKYVKPVEEDKTESDPEDETPEDAPQTDGNREEETETDTPAEGAGEADAEKKDIEEDKTEKEENTAEGTPAEEAQGEENGGEDTRNEEEKDKETQSEEDLNIKENEEEADKTEDGAKTSETDETDEEKVTEFACDLPGAQDISLAETISSLGIAAEEEVSTFMADIETVCVTNPEVVNLTQTEDDWSFRVMKESGGQEALTISMADETVYTITTNADGIKEVAAEDNAAVITTENDFYLPEEANAYVENLTEAKGEEAVSAIQDQTTETGDTSAYQVYDIGIENVDPEQYEGFQVEIKLDEEATGKDFKLYQVQDGNATDITDTLQLSSSENEDGTQNVSAITFKTEEFAQFVLCYTLEAFVKTHDGCRCARWLRTESSRDSPGRSGLSAVPG